MLEVDTGASRSSALQDDPTWADLGLEPPWQDIVSELSGGDSPRQVQAESIRAGLLTSRKNLLVSAPTNAGKSLVGTLALLQVLKTGKRAVLLEPLRALAREQTDTLIRLAPMLSRMLKTEFSVRISTGDYRLEDEQFSDAAPGAELIVATPERFEAILRNPENHEWAQSIGAVCVDEAHLISSPRRGPTLEFLITSLLAMQAPPRLVLLSATLGDVGKAAEWLRPSEVVLITERYPPLKKEVLELSEGQDANDAVASRLRDVLADEQAQGLVFVYQTRSTQALASQLTEQLGDLAGEKGAVAYHSQMSTAQREVARDYYLSGQSRVVVTTSALALGVNLPATHVIVRDLTYPAAESPGVSDLLQMMGRAGRGDTPGRAVVLKRPSDAWQIEDLREQLEEERLPPFHSAFMVSPRGEDSANLRKIGELITSLLFRYGQEGMTATEIETFFSKSLGGPETVGQIQAALRLLTEDTLSFVEGDRYKLTVLGHESTRAVLPLHVAAGFAQLIRDLLSIDPDDKYLGQWSPTDHLIVLNLLHESVPKLRRYSARLADQVTDWAEDGGNASMLFSQWIHGAEGHSKADQVLGSLGMTGPEDRTLRNATEWMRQRAFIAMFQSIVLVERGRGKSVGDIERQYGLTNLEGVEERWRDAMLWLLNGLAGILNIRTFYYHLREECGADDERIKRVKRLLGSMRHQTYDLQEQIKYCSPLGPALRDIRQVAGGGVGVQTIRTLEEAGITTLRDLNRLGIDGLRGLGIRKDIAQKIALYLRRRFA